MKSIGFAWTANVKLSRNQKCRQQWCLSSCSCYNCCPEDTDRFQPPMPVLFLLHLNFGLPGFAFKVHFITSLCYLPPCFYPRYLCFNVISVTSFCLTRLPQPFCDTFSTNREVCAVCPYLFSMLHQHKEGLFKYHSCIVFLLLYLSF